MASTFRRGTLDDCRAAFDIFTQAVAGLERRQGTPDSKNVWLNPEFIAADLYARGDQVVGYGYFGQESGPVAPLHAADFPAVLARAETEAAANNEETFGLQVPLINRAAVDYLLGRGFKLDEFTNYFMTDEPFGTFDHYIFTSPPFFI